MTSVHETPDTVRVGPEAPPSPPVYRRAWAVHIGAFIVYGVLALRAYWPVLPGQSSRIPACVCGDPALQTWFLRWVPFALAHGHNPLFSDWTNYPLGVNLAQNTSMPLLSLITAPLTLAVSPIASYNLLLWLAFPASATAMFFVVKRWTGSTTAAFIGGLLYGFSAYTVGQGVGHVMLSFVPLPPLYFYQLHKLLVRREGSPYRQGLLLGLIGVLQFFIEPELLATLVIMSALGLVILALAKRRSITWSAVRYSSLGLACCGAVIAPLVAYPVWFIVSGTQHFTGPVRPVINPFHVDLFGPIIPTLSQHFAPHSLLVKYGHKFGNVENGSYLGVPLLLLAFLLVARFRRNRWILFCLAMAVCAYVLSLGPRLFVLTHRTSVPLPFALLARLPLLDNLVPGRLSMYESLFVSLVVALGISELIRYSKSDRSHHRTKQHARRAWGRHTTAALTVGLGILTVITLIPRWPSSSARSGVPAFFTSPAVKQTPADSVVLTYPFPEYPNNQAMMWQAVSGMRFKQTGTYTLDRGANGGASPYPTLLSPAAVQEFFVDEQTVVAPGKPVPVPSPVNATLETDLRQYLTTYAISTVIVDQDRTIKGRAAAMQLFVDTLGSPKLTGGVAVWFDVPALLKSEVTRS